MHVKMIESENLIPISFLQSGNDLPLTDTLSFKHPTIHEIMSLDTEHNGLYSEEIYYSMINIFLTDPYDYMVYLDDHGFDYESTTPFKLFLLLYQDRMKTYSEYLNNNPDTDINEIIKNDIYFRAFKFFIDVDDFLVVNIDDKSVVCTKSGEFICDEQSYDYIFSFVKLCNGIYNVDRINPENAFAKQILIEDEREKIKKKKNKNLDSDDNKKSNRIGNMLSSITWCCNGGITPFNRNRLHIYDLIDGVNKYNKLLNYNNTMHGLYSGTVDKKSINFNSIHWSL